MVVVSTLRPFDREPVIGFLLLLNAPVYLEGISGIREEPKLQHLRITSIDYLWQVSTQAQYSIDGLLRIGGVPTLSAWRDLETMQGRIEVCSVSHLPFSGLSYGGVVHAPLTRFFDSFDLPKKFDIEEAGIWLEADRAIQASLMNLIKEEPCAEPSLFFHLSSHIPAKSLVYLGNSLPIREWDLAATYQNKGLEVHASRGLNGIDGQISTFLGMALPDRENWGIFGDLTFMYDFAGFWVKKQMEEISTRVVVINNGGGQIFASKFPQKEFQNSHGCTFEHAASHWGLAYCRDLKVSEDISHGRSCLVELTPDLASTERFRKKHAQIFFASLSFCV